MKNFTLEFIFLLAFAFIFVIQANAQLCGTYTTTLQIKTAEGKPIETAVVQLFPIVEDETKGKTFVRDEKDFSKFSVTFFEGHQIKTTYRLLIFADGFENFVKNIKFPHCKKQTFDIQLTRNSQMKSAIIMGTVLDETGAAIQNAKVSFLGENKLRNTYLTNADGVFAVNLSLGNYSIRVEAPGFQFFYLQKYRVAPSYEGKMNLDVVLEVKPCDDCNWIKNDPIKENNN